MSGPRLDPVPFEVLPIGAYFFWPGGSTAVVCRMTKLTDTSYVDGRGKEWSMRDIETEVEPLGEGGLP